MQKTWHRPGIFTFTRNLYSPSRQNEKKMKTISKQRCKLHSLLIENIRIELTDIHTRTRTRTWQVNQIFFSLWFKPSLDDDGNRSTAASPQVWWGNVFVWYTRNTSCGANIYTGLHVTSCIRPDLSVQGKRRKISASDRSCSGRRDRCGYPVVWKK
jgi:hypothetical protein